MPITIADHYLADIRTRFRSQRDLAEKAFAQVADADFFRPIHQDANSIGVLLKHVGGNLRSRWTDALTSDGEKPDRQRDREFEHEAADTRQDALAAWAAGWLVVEQALASFTPDDLLKPVVIRSESMTLLEALSRSIVHTAQHVGQIILLARHFAGDRWQTLSIPRGQSDQFRREFEQRHR